MRFNSLRFKIRLFFSSTLFLLLLILGIILIFSVKHIVYKDIGRDLRAKAIQIESILDAYAEVRSSEFHPAVMFQNLIYNTKLTSIKMDIINKLWHADVKALNIRYDYFRLVDASGTSVLVSENSPEPLLGIFNSAAQGSFLSKEVLTNISYNGKRYRFINFPLEFTGGRALSLQIATPLERADAIIMNISLVVLFGIAGITFLTILLGNILADKTLQPMMRVISVTDTITHKDLSVRIEETGEYEEIRKLINSFNVMVGRLEKSFGHINEFSSHVAHELKTPLAIMKGELELAMSDAGIDEKDIIIYETILGEVDKLGTIIKDMLLLAKLDYDRSVYNFEKTDMKIFFKDIYEQSLVLANAKGIHLKLVLPEGKLDALADATHLRRLFLNLINNSVNYTPRAGSIDVNVTIWKDELRADIRDSGEGISPEDLKRIFDKFFRVKNGVSGLNVGLGLTIALSIARAHRGGITATSAPGKGSTFTVTLPAL